MTSPWVKPGEMLGYAQRLKKEGLWPPRPGAPPPRKPGDVRPATASPGRRILLRARVSDFRRRSRAALRLSHKSPGWPTFTSTRNSA
jgi:hypothetical protein